MTEKELNSIFNTVLGNGHGVEIIFPKSYEPIGESGYGSVCEEDMDEPFLLSYNENCSTTKGSVVNCTISLDDFLEDVKEEIVKVVKRIKDK